MPFNNHHVLSVSTKHKTLKYLIFHCYTKKLTTCRRGRFVQSAQLILSGLPHAAGTGQLPARWQKSPTISHKSYFTHSNRLFTFAQCLVYSILMTCMYGLVPSIILSTVVYNPETQSG